MAVHSTAGDPAPVSFNGLGHVCFDSKSNGKYRPDIAGATQWYRVTVPGSSVRIDVEVASGATNDQVIAAAKELLGVVTFAADPVLQLLDS